MAHSRVEAGAGVLGLLYEAGHVLEEEVVHVLLVHVAQLRVAAHVHLQQHDGVNTDKYRGWYLWIGPAVLAAGSWSWCCVEMDGDGMVCRSLLRLVSVHMQECGTWLSGGDSCLLSSAPQLWPSCVDRGASGQAVSTQK